jgi:hypothetical protein
VLVHLSREGLVAGVQDMLAPPVASMTVASMIKLNIICVSLILAVSRCVYFSGRLGGAAAPELCYFESLRAWSW